MLDVDASVLQASGLRVRALYIRDVQIVGLASVSANALKAADAETCQDLRRRVSYPKSCAISDPDKREDLYDRWSSEAWALFEEWLPTEHAELDKQKLIEYLRGMMGASTEEGAIEKKECLVPWLSPSRVRIIRKHV